MPPPHRHWSYIASFSMLICLFLFSSCDKEAESLEIDNENYSASLTTRTASDDLLWVQGFQSHLQNLYNGHPVSQTYTLNEATYGLEWLFNFKYAEGQKGFSKSGEKLIIDLPSSSNWLALYSQIEDHIENEIFDNPTLDFDFVNINIDEGEDTEHVTIQSHYTFIDQCLSDEFTNSDSGPPDCDNPPFTNDQSYYLGLGGEDGEEPWLPCELTSADVCGGANCGSRLFALEMVENIYEFNLKNQFICKNGGSPFFTNVQTLFNITNPLPIDEIINECNPNIEDDLRGCTCVTADALNCLYCKTIDITENLSPHILAQIPPNSEVIDVDLFVNYINGTGLTYYSLHITTAEFHCRKSTIIRDQPAIFIELCC